MNIPIYRRTEPATIDDVCAALAQYRWCASFCRARGVGPSLIGVVEPGGDENSGGGSALAGLTIYRPAQRFRSYYYCKRHWRENGRYRSEQLSHAVLRLLGETVPAGHRVWFRNGDTLDCTRANLVIADKPPGGWRIPR